MFLSGLGTAAPPQRYSQAQCWEAFRACEHYRRLGRRAQVLVEQVLLGDNGIAARHLVPAELHEVFHINPDTLHRRFAEHAPRLATEAAVRALDDAGLTAGQVDAVIASTCTGYLCPGITSYLIEGLGLCPEVLAFDLVGQGCAAALPNWSMAEALVSAGRARHVLSVCVEVSSAAMYVDDDPGVLISGCLFGDGAGAALLSARPPSGRRRIAWQKGGSLTDPGRRDLLRFEQRGGMLRNILTRPVPQLAARYAAEVLGRVLKAEEVAREEIGAWIWHAGGRDVLSALQERLGLSEEQLRYSRAMLAEYGNLSSAFVYFVLEAALRDPAPGGLWWMSSFGAGFSCHGALLRVD